MGENRARLLTAAVSHLFRFAPWRLAAVFSVLLLQGITSGIGLLALLPLLQILGIDKTPQGAGGGSSMGDRLFVLLHLPRNLPVILVFYVVLVTCLAGLRYWQTVSTVSIQQGYVVGLRDRLLRSLFHARWDYVLQRKTSEFIHTLSGQIQSVGIICMQSIQLLSQATLLAAYLVTALLLSWPMTAVALGASIFFLLLLLPLHRQMLVSGQGQLSGYKAIFHQISEQLVSFKMIKSHAGEDLYADKILAISRQLERQQLVNCRITALTQLVYMVGAVTVFSGVFYISYSFLTNDMGRLLLLLFIFSRILPQTSALQRTYQMLLHQLPAFADVMALETDCRRHAEPGGNDHKLEFSSAICLEEISFGYRPDQPVIARVSATIRHRQTVFIGGPSGAGKTTLVDVVAGLLTPDSGRVTIDGCPLTATAMYSWRRGLAYVTQEVFLLHDTIRNNLQWNGVEVSDKRLWQVLEDAAANAFVEQCPAGLDTVIGDRGIRLSGGERQRIALARALLSDPVLLILDEATSALDSDNEEKIFHALKRLRGKTTILVISHRETFKQVADQQILLRGPSIERVDP